MAFPKDYLSWDVWNKTKAIWLISILNLLLNGISVYLLWMIYGVLANHGVAQIVQGVQQGQQIAVVKGG